MHERMTMQSNHRGAALLTALGLLSIFCLMGVAYVDYMYVTTDATRYDQRLLHVRTLASAGVQAGIGNIQQALTNGRIADLLATPRNIEIPLYGSNRQDPKGFSPQSNRRAAAKVTVAEENGPLLDLAKKEGKSSAVCYRILSEAALSDLAPGNLELRATHARAEAVVLFGDRLIPRVIYWNETD